jgi:hypothetical protein
MKRPKEFSEAEMDTIKRFVFDANFLTIKDVFVSNAPNGGKDSTDIVHNAGKASGTLYVFNEMESLVKAKPKQEQIKRQGQDPDLSDE